MTALILADSADELCFVVSLHSPVILCLEERQPVLKTGIKPGRNSGRAIS